MKMFSRLVVAAALVLGVVALASAGEKTLTGGVMCAKCILKKADASQCQDVLIVKNDQGEQAEYYVVKNAVAEKFGHTCSGEVQATVTGEVSEKDGRMWIAPSKMEKVEKAS